LAVATSIDALAVGVSLTFMGVNYWNEIAMPVAIITIISSLLTYVGLHIGIRIGRKIPFSPTPIGGIILIGIGIKIIIEHLS
jgi:putative Mn2+ efflux pump MntP